MIRLNLDSKTVLFQEEIRELVKAFFPGESFQIVKDNDISYYELERTAGREPMDSEPSLTLSILSNSLPLTGRRPEDKSIIKQDLYKTLCSMTGRILPWGNLTGIRPVTLAEPMLYEASSRDPEGRVTEEALFSIRKMLSEKYQIGERKLDLLLDIAMRERESLQRLKEVTGLPARKGWSLYIGIPFCPTRCLYCSFTSNPVSKWESSIPAYLDCLRREIRFCVEEMCGKRGRALQTIYVGGGTPTALPEDALLKLMDIIREECFAHPFSRICEFTVEAGRPDSITKAKLEILRSSGVDRISVNPQSFLQKTLDLIGRRHSVEDVYRSYQLARESGFDNINMDIILGLPGERLPELTETLCRIAGLHPDSLTVHSLSVKRAARLRTEKQEWEGVYRAGADFTLHEEELPGGETLLLTEMERMMMAAEYAAGELSLFPYYLYRQKNMSGNLENVGYSRAGKECLYNILMMGEKHTVMGCGAGSASKVIVFEEDEQVCSAGGYLCQNSERLKSSRIDRGNGQGPEVGEGEEGLRNLTGNRFSSPRICRCDNGKDIRRYMERMDLMLERKGNILSNLPERKGMVF